MRPTHTLFGERRPHRSFSFFYRYLHHITMQMYKQMALAASTCFNVTKNATLVVDAQVCTLVSLYTLCYRDQRNGYRLVCMLHTIC